MYEDKFRRFSALVARADKALLRAKAMNTRSSVLRGVHVSCLLELLEHPDGLTSGELAGACGVDRRRFRAWPPQLTEQGLIEGPGRESSAATRTAAPDGRGPRRATAMIGIVDDKLERVASGLSAGDLETFYRVFGTIVERLEQI